MTSPTVEQLEAAASWLDYYEGEDDNSEACKAVAEWLRDQAVAKELRTAAKENGVSVSRLRAALARQQS